jgi:hypothetical protein
MKTKNYRTKFHRHPAKSLVAFLIVALLAFGNVAVFARQEQTATPAPTDAAAETPKIPSDQLDSLVAPVALYPDPLLSQVLVASTYPLELVQLQQWIHMRGQYMNEAAQVAAVEKEDWDPSIKAMVLLPAVTKRLSENIKWTADLGNAFLAQQSDVMDAVQRMRVKAKDAGKLQSNEQMKVETQQVEDKSYVIIEQASPEVVYVPSYDPAIIWGTVGYYPYPPIYYAPYAGLYAWGAGIAMGALWRGGWGWGAGWGGNDININRNNNFNRNTNINRGDRVNHLNSGNNRWQHNPQHRGGAPYANRDIANRFGGATRGDSIANRQANARQNLGNFGGGRPSAGTLDRNGLRSGNFGGLGSGGRPSAGTMDRSGLGGNRSGFGGDRIGSRDVSRGGFGGRNNGSFGGGGSWGGGAARTSSNRGYSSMRSSGGSYGGRSSGSFGGRGGGGGMRGGGMRGGGGGRRR